MTIGTLIKTCLNIHSNTSIMIYHTLEDFENATPNWNSCKAESVIDSEAKIVVFQILNPNLVAVALA